MSYPGLVYHTILDAAELGRQVAAAYALPQPLTCTLFNSGVNEIYFIHAGAAQYVLRVARAQRLGTFGAEVYRGELELLDFLHTAGLPVSRPLPRRDGAWLGWFDTPDGPRAWAVFEFVPGKPPVELSADLAGQAGKLLAQVHVLADRFKPSSPRIYLDTSFLIDEPLERLRRFSALPAQDLAWIEQAALPLRSWQLQQPQPAGAYGLLHGDYWWSNLHLTAQGLALIDFDFCGYGWRAYDLAALLVTAKILRYPLDAGAFLDGYQSVRPLSSGELESIPYWEKIRLIWVFGLWTTFENLRGTRWFFEFFTPAFAGFQQLFS